MNRQEYLDSLRSFELAVQHGKISIPGVLYEVMAAARAKAPPPQPGPRFDGPVRICSAEANAERDYNPCELSGRVRRRSQGVAGAATLKVRLQGSLRDVLKLLDVSDEFVDLEVDFNEMSGETLEALMLAIHSNLMAQ